MFYISSRGHSATGWLSKQISKHPKVVCWHGTRSIPPYHSGKNDLSPKEFVSGLIQCEKKDSRIYGSCHGFYGITLKDLVIEKGGNFACIFRDPISKISSFFFAYFWSRLSNGLLPEDYRGPNEQIFGNKKLMERAESHLENIRHSFGNKKQSPLESLFKKIHFLLINYTKKNKTLNNLDPKKLEQKILLKDNSRLIAELFDSICKTTFFYDDQLNENCEAFQIIQMEKMTTSNEYFAENVWNKLIPAFRNQAPLDSFAEKTKPHNPNFHDSAQKKYEYLPKAFQRHFKWYLSKQGKKLLSKYKQFNYFLI